MVTSVVPLMCFTINLATIFHIYFSLKETSSFQLTLKHKLLPIALMIITTCVGFGSLGVSSIQSIEQFGVLSSFLILVTCLFSFAWMFSADDFFTFSDKESRLPLKLCFLFEKSLKSHYIILLAGVSLFLGLFAIKNIPIVTDATKYFPKSSGLKRDIDSVNESVVGVPLYEIHIGTKKERSLSEERFFLDLEDSLMKKISEGPEVTGSLSLNSMIREANKEYSGEYKLPDHSISYNVLKSKVGPSVKDSYSTSSKYRITILGRPMDIDSYEKGLDQIKIFFENKNVDYGVNGLYFNLMTSQKELIGVLAKSFILALAIVSAMAFFYLRKIKIFFIFIFVNTIPVAISLYVLYILGFSINIATVMTYSIGLGMIVDSSFHLIHSYQNSKTISFLEYIKTTVIPIVGSSGLLVFCFSLFGINEFLPIKQFGINLGILLSIGLIFDLYILPTLFLGSSNIASIFKGKE